MERGGRRSRLDPGCGVTTALVLPQSRPQDSWNWSLILYLTHPNHCQGAMGSRHQHVGNT